MNQTTFLGMAYWIAAAVDGFIAVGMLFPQLLQPALQLASVPSSVETHYTLGVGAALMFGWTALLIWAAAEPVARRTILLLTIMPVIAGLALLTLYGSLNGYIRFGGALSVWVLQTLLVLLLGWAYRLASQ